MRIDFPANQSPRPDQMKAYTESRRIQERAYQVAGEMRALDGKNGDLDPAPDAVTLRGTTLASMPKAIGSVRFAGDKLQSLVVGGQEEDTLEFSKLKGGSTAHVNGRFVVVTSPDGDMKVETQAWRGVKKAIEDMRPMTVGESLFNGLRKTAAAAAAAVGGAIPVVGIIVNLALGCSAWPNDVDRQGMALVGFFASAVGTMALGPKFIPAAAASMAQAVGIVGIAALGLSAALAGASAFKAAGK